MYPLTQVHPFTLPRIMQSCRTISVVISVRFLWWMMNIVGKGDQKPNGTYWKMKNVRHLTGLK